MTQQELTIDDLEVCEWEEATFTIDPEKNIVVIKPALHRRINVRGYEFSKPQLHTLGFTPYRVKAPSEPALFPQVGDECWGLYNYGKPFNWRWATGESDNFGLNCQKIHNCFPTEEAAKEYANYLTSDEHKKNFQAWQEKEAKPEEKVYTFWEALEEPGQYVGEHNGNSMTVVTPGAVQFYQDGRTVIYMIDRISTIYRKLDESAEARLADLRGGK